MNIKQSNDDQAVNLEHFLGENLIIEYLTRGDIIKLSMCSKYFRKQLEKQIYSSLSLTSWLRKNEDIEVELKHSGVYDKLIGILKDNLGDKLKLVKKLIFKDVFCFGVAADVFYLLPNVNNIEFSAPYCGCCGHMSLSFINGRQNLEHIKFITYCKDYNYFDKEGTIFPKSLKSLKINDDPESFGKIHYFDSINSSYTNLVTLDIATNEMLKNLTLMPNLKNVGILRDKEIDKPLVLKFIKKNPQLKKLEFYHWPFEKLAQEILSFKSLSYLSIFSTWYYSPDISIYPANYSIKTLYFGEEVYGSRVINLINACKMLETLVLCKWHHENLEEAEWNKLKKSIKTIHCSYYNYCNEEYIYILDTLQFFDKAIITRLYSEDEEIEEINFNRLKNYKLSPSPSSDSNFFTIVKTIK